MADILSLHSFDANLVVLKPRRASRRDSQKGRLIENLESRILYSTYIVTTAAEGLSAVNQVFGNIYATATLRSAVNAANAHPGNDTIYINPFVHANIMLDPALGQLNITDDVTIEGFDARRVTVNGDGLSRVFSVNAGVTASINDLTVMNGSSTFTGGGGIRNAGTLSVVNCAITNNVTGSADGAGLFNTGTVTITGSTFSKNTAGGSGGGLFNAGVATVINSTFSGNNAFYGGAISNADGATLSVYNSTISGNHATISGGGISATLNFPLTEVSGTLLHNTIVAGNSFDAINGGLGTDLYGFYLPASSNNLIGSLGFAKGLDASKNLLGSISNTTPVIDAKLGVLAYNGGPTQTMLLQAGSPAIDAGNISLIPTGVTTDQRGHHRVVKGKVDIGAVQTDAFMSWW